MDYADYQKYSGREVQEDENMNYLRKGKGISLSMNKVIIGVDRDGTLIVDPGYYGSQANWRDSFRIVPYAIEGLSLLSGFFPNSYIIVFSNQSGPAQEIVKEETVYEINNLLKRTFYKDNIHIELFMNSFKISKAMAIARGIPENNPYVDRDSPGNNPQYLDPNYCRTRKPNDGLYYDALNLLGMNEKDIKHTIMIGDKHTDIEFGLNIGALSCFVKTNSENEEAKAKYLSKTIMLQKESPARVFIAEHMKEAAEWIIEQFIKRYG